MSRDRIGAPRPETGLDASRDHLSMILHNGVSDFRSPPLPSAQKRQRASSQQSDLSNAPTTSVHATPSLDVPSSIHDLAVVCSQSTVKRRGRPPRDPRQVIICVNVILVFIFSLLSVKVYLSFAGGACSVNLCS